MLGLWTAGCLIFFFLASPPWLQLIDRGQFFLYSVGFLGQALYVLTKERKITHIPYRPQLTFASVVALLMCAVIFSGTVLSNFTNSPDIVPRMLLLRTLGIFTFIISMLVGMLAMMVDEDRDTFDFNELSDSSGSRLEERVSGI